jgi:hypothetical protein
MKFDEYFIKERTGHIKKYQIWIKSSFFFCRLNWSIVNTDHESTHECNFYFADNPGKL